MAHGVFDRGRCLRTTIPAGLATSIPVQTFGMAIVSALIPSGFTGTTITIEESPDGVNYGTRFSSGADEVVQFAADKVVDFWPYIRAGWVRLVAGTVQAAEREVLLYVQEGA